jgi:tetratricopeptide (TPR) repeat protein
VFQIAAHVAAMPGTPGLSLLPVKHLQKAGIGSIVHIPAFTAENFCIMNLANLNWRGVAAGLALFVASVVPVSAQTCEANRTASPDDVIKACTQLISSGRDNGTKLAHYYNERGVALTSKHDNNRAIEDFSNALKINSRSSVVYHNRGVSYHNIGDEKRAIEDYGRAIEIDPKYSDAYLERARALRGLRDYDKAIRDLDTVVQLNPKLVAGYLLRGAIYGQKSDYDHALPDLNQAIALEPSADSFFARGSAYAQKNDFDRASADLNRAIDLNPKAAAYYIQRGVLYERRGFIENALLDYEEAIRLEPSNTVALKDRGLVRRRKGDLQGAVADYSQAIKLDPRYNAAYTERGRAYEALNNIAAARLDYENAASLPPRYDSGQAAIDTARARLAALSAAGVTPPKAPSPSPPLPGPAAVGPVSLVEKPQRVAPPAPGPASVSPSRKLALVLGNSTYQRQALRNPDNDARAMAKALRQIGFQVIDGYNLDYAGMRRLISQFAVEASTAQLALVFYAGHGLGIAGHNYLVPIDAKVESSVAANFELFDLDQIIAALDDPARTTIVILDACRNNPFATQATTRDLNRGGGLVGYDSVAAGMLIAFATRPGQVAKDGSGDHSPFTAALLKYIATPNLEILDMMRRVRRDVLQETNGEQITWDNESLFGNVFLVDGGAHEVAK